MFGRAQTAAFLGAIAVSRLGLRETDFRSLLPALGHTDWDELRFAQLRRIFRGQLRQREPLGRWDFDHRQMRKAVRGWLTDIGVQERDLHGAIHGRSKIFDHGVRPRSWNGRCMSRPAHRVASEMSRRPAKCSAPIPRLRRPAMTRGPERVRAREWSSR